IPNLSIAAVSLRVGGGLPWQLARLPTPGTTRGIPASSLLFREQAFLCAAGETGEQSWVQLLKSLSGEGLSGASGFKLSKPTQTGVWTYQQELPAPTPLRLIRVMCNDLFKVNPLHLRQFGAYPSTASLPLSPGCLDHKLNWRGKALGGGLVTEKN
ncbi:PREDICTED: LOW QUALITY PROTEIN: TGFB1-induced anti-apoptotic factor 1, partial [Bison bison bison]|uniref:LOW QUALITY PROTEIN: TGFB1-induced anti-apoptotic factor 1 n=1 Tax=Bison bison bison TaxID=43346 RepID=A0A6P3J7R1_BISBB